MLQWHTVDRDEVAAVSAFNYAVAMPLLCKLKSHMIGPDVVRWWG